MSAACSGIRPDSKMDEVCGCGHERRVHAIRGWVGDVDDVVCLACGGYLETPAGIVGRLERIKRDEEA